MGATIIYNPHAAIAAEAYTCPKCGERSTKGQLSQTGFHCPRCTLELAHLDLAPNGTVRQLHGWLLAPGDVVQGRYRVTSVLGKGGFAATYLVTDERLQGKRRALKEMPRDLYDEHETALLARLRHPAIPDISDRFEVDGMVYLVLEFGGTQSLEGERKASGGTIPPGRLVPWMHQLCEVLAYLHGRTPPIVHRDLKPENILLDEDDRIMLTLARSVSHGFSPPEQVLGTGTDQRSDVYALGATMYALLTGMVPPAAHERVAGKELPAPRALNPAIPEALDAVILQALDLNLNRRPQTIAALSRVFMPGTLDAPLPDAGLGTRTVRVGAERPLRAPARIPIRTGRVTDAAAGIEPRGRRALWIIAGGLVVASAVAAWRLLEPRSPAAHIEAPAAPVAATPAVPVTTPTDSPAPPPPAPVQPEPPRPQELGPASRFLEEGLSKQTTPTVVTPTPPPILTTSPGTRPVAPDPIGKVAPPLDPVGTKEVPNQKRPPVALAPSPPRSPSTRPPKKQAAREPSTKGRPPLDLIDKVHDR